MARTKSGSLKPFQKILTLMLSGKAVTIDEIEQTLGSEIQMYRLSTYIWHIKTRANGAIKTVKDGRKVVAYQLVNVKEIKDYMAAQNFTKPAAKVAKTKTKKVEKLADLDAEQSVEPVSSVVASDTVEVVEVTETTSSAFEPALL
jgi:hypothetical protein